MNSGFLSYYERELQHLRGIAGEFARDFPKIAGRLSLEQFECADPYVERLLEGFAFLTARVQHKFDAEFPRFTQSLLSTVYPHFLAPTPSMVIARFQPNLSDSGLASGANVPRDTALRSIVGKGERTPCEYRTAHDVTLLPLAITQVDYLTREMSVLKLPPTISARAALRIRLETGADLPFSALSLDRLVFHILGTDAIPLTLYEQVFAHGCGVVCQSTERPAPAFRSPLLPKEALGRVGFDDAQALLPFGCRSFQGYRLLHEYFAFPQRFLFFEVSGLQEAAARCKSKEMDLIVLLDQPCPELDNRIDATNLALFCTPAINLFPKRLDRVQLTDRFAEHHLVPDRTRGRDFEVYDVLDVTGLGESSDDEQPFRPFYAMNDFNAAEGAGAYYVLNRIPRVWSSQEKEKGRQSTYQDSEVFISLVDAKAAPYRSELRQLAVRARCTNRDLPLRMPINRGRTDFTLDGIAAIDSVRCAAGPTPPRPACMEGEIAWRAISHLSLNYLSLLDAPDEQGAVALRDLLKLYTDAHASHAQKQIDGLLSAGSKPLVRRVPSDGPITFARGIEIAVTFDERPFEGSSAFLLGAVLERFFAKYVSINSFTETVIRSATRGEMMRWPTRLGLRHLL